MKFQLRMVFVFMAITLGACAQTDNTEKKSTQEEVQTQASSPIVLSTEEFRSKLELPDVQLIDVRTDAELAEGKISDATQMDVMQWDSFVASAKNLDPSKPVLVYCRKGGRSNKAATYLAENGFGEVYDLQGGITSWIAEGGKVTKP